MNAQCSPFLGPTAALTEKRGGFGVQRRRQFNVQTTSAKKVTTRSHSFATFCFSSTQKEKTRAVCRQLMLLNGQKKNFRGNSWWAGQKVGAKKRLLGKKSVALGMSLLVQLTQTPARAKPGCTCQFRQTLWNGRHAAYSRTRARTRARTHRSGRIDAIGT